MIKRIAVLLSLVIVLSVLVTPAYAQTTTSPSNEGLFSRFTHFFGRLFHPENNGQTQATEDNSEPGQPNPSMSPMPSGMPDRQEMEQHRLSLLVKQGKITQAQANAILAELIKIQNELKAWADSQGINESYVLGSTGPGMSGVNNMMRQGEPEGQNQGQNQGQMHPMMHPGSSGGQQGGQFGGQPPQGQK